MRQTGVLQLSQTNAIVYSATLRFVGLALVKSIDLLQSWNYRVRLFLEGALKIVKLLQIVLGG